MNELLLIPLMACFAAFAFYGFVYLMRNPTFDVEFYVRERIRDYIESRTIDEDFADIPVPQTVIPSSPFGELSIEEPTVEEATRIVEFSSDMLSSADDQSSPETPAFDPFQIHRNGPSICGHFFSNCLPMAPTMTRKPLKMYTKERIPMWIPAENATTRLWAGLYWNQWQWAYERWTTLHNVAELRLFEDVEDTFLSSVFSLPDNLSPKHGDEFVKIHEEQFLWDFLNGVRTDPPVCRFYKTNYAALEASAKTEKDTDWKSWLIVDKTLDSNYSSVAVPPLLHYLYPGCAVQAQYSEYHTARVVLKGAARFVLISPQQSTKMHLYPYTHPKSRQSQIDWFGDHAKLGDYDDAKSITAAYVDTLPGDVVLVPPGWLIHTEAHNATIFLDIHSPSLEQVNLLEAMSMRLPFPGSLTNDEKIVYAQVYLVHVLSRIHGLSSIRTYANKLFQARYGILFPENSLYMQQQTFQCFADNTDFHQATVNKMNKIQLQQYADFVAKRFNDERIAASLRWLWLGNYVDSILRWTYGGHAVGEAAVFLRTCLTMDGKIEVVEEVEGPSVLRFDPKEEL